MDEPMRAAAPGQAVSPPEGVIAGEDVPHENEVDERYRVALERMRVALKQRGEPYSTMSKTELDERARRSLELLKNSEVRHG